MRKNNCTISIANFGIARVMATRVVHGMSVVAYAGEAESRAGKAFYPSKRTSGSFELTVIFSTTRAYRDFNQWLQRYSRWAGNPKTHATPVRVTIPSRRFDKTGVLEEGMEFGDDVRAVTHSVTLGFVGSRDPLELRRNKAISRFRMGRARGDKALPYFYPAGTQLKGDVRGWDTVYDLEEEAEREREEDYARLPNLNPSRPGIFE